MPVFSGAYEHVLDAKGRAVLPLGLRKCVPEEDRKAYFRRGFKLRRAERGRKLHLVPVDRFEASYEALKQAANGAAVEREDEILQFTSLVAHIDLDEQYRFNLPPQYTEHAELGREIVFVGAGDIIQIWRDDDWKRWAKARWDLMASR